LERKEKKVKVALK